MLVYATPTDLANWEPSLNLDNPSAVAVLRSASLLIARAVNESLYDESTVSTPPKRDATTAQATAWVKAKIDPEAGAAGLTGLVTAKTNDGASITYSVPDIATREQALAALCADAYNILYDNGLWVPLPVWSQCPDQGVFVSEFGVVGGRAGPPGPVFGA